LEVIAVPVSQVAVRKLLFDKLIDVFLDKKWIAYLALPLQKCIDQSSFHFGVSRVIRDILPLAGVLL
jgi:hypothetical protein